MPKTPCLLITLEHKKHWHHAGGWPEKMLVRGTICHQLASAIGQNGVMTKRLAATASKAQVATGYDPLRSHRIAAIAERLDVSVRTVERMVADGDLKTFRPRLNGRTVRVTEQALRDYLEKATA